MNVRELIQYLQKFEDQEAEVRVLHCEPGHSYYAQGGMTSEVPFDPELHFEHADLRENKFAKGTAVEKVHYVTLGLKEA